MQANFNIDEVFEMAEQMERNGAAFYRKAAENATEDTTVKMLTDLAEMEEDHERTFQRMRERLSQSIGDKVYDPQGEAAQYLQAMMTGAVFGVKGDPTRDLKGTEPLSQILITAIQLEKDSIAFYSGIKEAMPADLGKDKIEAIIREEMSHVTLLNRRLGEIE